MSAGPTSLVDLLSAAQRRFPQRRAFRYGGIDTNYADLWRSVIALAQGLRAHGLQPGERVALLLESSPEYAIAYYAVLSAGGVAVGLNTAARGPELAKNVAHCSAAMLIAASEHPELPGLMASCKCLRRVMVTSPVASTRCVPAGVLSWAELIAGAPADADGAGVGPVLDAHSPATIIYTSGTTGDPRGVTLSHRNLVANTLSILEYLQLTESDSILNVLPFYYSYGNSVLHTHLAVGAALILENSLIYPHLVVKAMAAERATGFSGVPSTFALLLHRVNLGDYDLTALRYLTQAGGAMTLSMVNRVRSAVPHARLFVMYGQTEATARITYLPPERLQDKLGSVGVAIPGVDLEVRDEHDAPVPAGSVGQVCVRGENVMLGYWNNPAATEAVLAGGWLHTGDLGSLDTDGFLTLIGRSSDMIKTGAHRVSPLEIEEVLAELDGVAECAAVGVADEILGEVIKAFVVPRAGAALDARRVQAHCRSRLAAYKVPKTVECVTTLPKTASGKIRRFMLKQAG